MKHYKKEPEITTEEKISKIKFLLSKDDCDIIKIIELNNSIIYSNSKEESTLKELIWNKEFDILFNNKTELTSSKYPSMLILNHLLSQAYDYNIKDINKIKYLESLRDTGINIIKKIKKCKSINEIEKIKKQNEEININLEDYYIKRETKIKAAQIKQQEVESSDLSSTEKVIEKKSKKYKKNLIKEEEENKEIEILSEKNIENNNVIDLNSQTIKISDMDEDSMEIEEVIQLEEKKEKKKSNKEIELKENEDDDVIIQDNFINNEIIIKENKNKIEETKNKDEEEINKILNKKTKRNKIDFQINKISSNNNIDLNKDKDKDKDSNILNKNIKIKIKKN